MSFEDVLYKSRSVLFNLPPEGMGTNLVESLTSYIVRLAAAHCVILGNLISELLAPTINKSYILKGSQRHSDPFFTHSYKLNGQDILACDFVAAIQEHTNLESIKYLTMIPLAVLPAKGLLKPIQAWCPHCYEECHQSRKEIYTPLMWSIKGVNVCVIHSALLVDTCPNCHRHISHLTRKMRIGFCPMCMAWLGNECNPNNQIPDMEYNIWCTQQIGSMLRFVQETSAIFSKDTLSRNICLLLSDCNIITSQLLNTLGISKSTLHGWRHGENMPTVEHLLELCFLLGINMVDLMMEINHITSSEAKEFNKVPWHSRSKRPSKQINIENLKEKLYVEVSSNDIRSLEEVARRLDVSSKTLRKYYPIECKEISKNYIANQEQVVEQRIKEDHIKIENTISQLLAEGIYPSRDLVENYIGKKFILKNKKNNEIWRKIYKQFH